MKKALAAQRPASSSLNRRPGDEELAAGHVVDGAQFVRRTVKAGRDGVEISDHAIGE